MYRNKFVLLILLLPIIIAVVGSYYFSDFVKTFSMPENFWEIIILLIVSPLLEEICFRGLLQDIVAKSMLYYKVGPVLVVLLPNILFTVWHYHINSSYLYLLLVFLSGCIFGTVKILHHRLIYPILLHSYYNLVFLLMLFFVNVHAL